MSKKKYKLKISEQAKKQISKLPEKDQLEIVDGLSDLTDNPFDGAKECPPGLIDVLDILDEVGIDTMSGEKPTKEQQAEYIKRVKALFGEDYKQKMKAIADEMFNDDED